MFENPRSGRQARNFTTIVPKILDLKSSFEQIFFRKLSLGAPGKSAEIAPIHKKDSKEAAEHYRPISLLPIISKVLQRCVFNRLYDRLKCLITDFQQRFLKNQSCVTQLLAVLYDIGLSKT